MMYYKLRSTTVGIDQETTRPVAISIPAGSLVRVPDDFVATGGFVKVDWNGKSVQIFAVDLRDRGELIKARSA